MSFTGPTSSVIVVRRRSSPYVKHFTKMLLLLQFSTDFDKTWVYMINESMCLGKTFDPRGPREGHIRVKIRSNFKMLLLLQILSSNNTN